MANAETIKEFLVGLGFNVDQGSMRKFSGAIKTATGAVVGIGAALVAGTALVTRFVDAIAGELDTLENLAIKSNVSAKAILELGYAASLTNSDTDAATRSIESLSRAIGDASLGLGEGAKTFQFLGIRIRDARGQLKTADVVMREVGNRIRRFPMLQKMNFLQRLGIDPSLVTALTEDISDLRGEFRQVFSTLEIDADKAASSAKNFRNSLKQLLFVLDALKKFTALRLMEPLRQGIDQLRRLILNNLPRMKDILLASVGIIVKIGTAFLGVSIRIGQAIGKLIDHFVRINKATDGWAGYILAAAAAWKVLNLSFITSPVGIILTLATILAALFDDFLIWKERGESLFDWSAAEGGINAIINIVRAFADIFMASIGNAINALRAIVLFLVGDFEGAWQAWLDLLAGADSYFQGLFDLFRGLIDFIKWVAALLLGDLSGAWKAIGDTIDSVIGGITKAIDETKKFFGLKGETKTQSPIGGVDVETGALRPTPRTNLDSNLQRWSEQLLELGGPTEPLMAPALIPPSRPDSIIMGRDKVDQSISQRTEIIVQGSVDPEATARAVADQQARVNFNLARNLATVTR